MSGSAFNEWSFTDKTVETTHELAETLECNQKDLKECLQVVDINILMDTAEQMVRLLV
jgi:archaellum component FlaC